MIDRKIERSYGGGFGRQQLVADSIENFISHEKNVTSRGPITANIYEALIPC